MHEIILQDLVGKVLCLPVCSEDDELEAVIELIRTSGNMFTDEESEVEKYFLCRQVTNIF